MFNSIYIIKEKAADHQQMLIMVDLRLGSVLFPLWKKKEMDESRSSCTDILD